MALTRVTGVLCSGNICYDIPVWPVDNFNWGTTTWVQHLEGGIGGNGANTSYTLGKLGCPIKVYGIVGHDWQGDQLLGILSGAGVDVSAVQRSPLQTNSTVCVVKSDGDRLFLHRLGCSTEMRAETIRFDRPEAARFSHFHMANLFTLPDVRRNAETILSAARGAGKTTSLDTGWDPTGRWMEDVGPCLPYADLLFVNETEAKVLTGFDDPERAARRLQELGAQDVLVKLGSAGSALFTPEATYRAAPFSVDAIDTTGAGDCFAGGFLAAIHHGSSYPDALRFANAVGALNVQKLGAVTGVRSHDETLSWIASQSVATV